MKKIINFLMKTLLMISFIFVIFVNIYGNIKYPFCNETFILFTYWKENLIAFTGIIISVLYLFKN